MSSPHSQQRAAVSRHASAAPSDAGDVVGDVSERPMQIKILYNLDDISTTTYLARCPHPLNIQTVYVDVNTEIGVIELKSCIQAIVAASPELVTKLGQDYTVYAFDYSEYETPLVGQGLLSWVLASASSTPTAPADHSTTMVTGRVCKNILGLFSKGSRETLEVRLKLVPVPTCLQTEYFDRMEKHRRLVGEILDKPDTDSWDAFLNFDILRQSPAEQSTGTWVADQRACSTSFHQVLAQNMRVDAASSTCQQSNAIDMAGSSGHGNNVSRLVNAATIGRHLTDVPRPAHAVRSRPSSRAEGEDEQQSWRQQGQGEPAASETLPNGNGHNEGPPRKRARIQKTDWRGKSSFGANGESLRVTASTAASVRGYRAIAPNPATSGVSLTEQYPRPPTPLPKLPGRGQNRSQSLLRRPSTNRESSVYVSPYSDEPLSVAGSDRFSTSPEEEQNGSAIGTPMDIPSSPPIMRTASPAPSSPALPVLIKHLDSGFMSGPGDEASDCANNEMPATDEEGSRTVASRKARRKPPPSDCWEEVMPGPPELLPTRTFPIMSNNHGRDARAIRATSSTGARLDGPRTAMLDSDSVSKYKKTNTSSPRPRHVSVSHSVCPSANDSEELVNPRETASSNTNMARVFHPSPEDCTAVAPQPPAGTGPSHDVSHPEPDTQSAAFGHCPVVQPIGPILEMHHTSSNNIRPSVQPSGNGDISQAYRGDVSTSGAFEDAETAWAKPQPRCHAKKKKAIQDRLASSVARGTTPPYCNHCGAIETSTWRKAWTKIHEGSPKASNLDERDNLLALETVEEDESGAVVRYRVIVKAITLTDQGWSELTLCNPCGIWLNKWQSMRPPDKWSASRTQPNGKRRRPPKKKKNPTPMTHEPSKGECTEGTNSKSHLDGSADALLGTARNNPVSRPTRQRRLSLGEQPLSSSFTDHGDNIGQSVAERALQRAFHSSPPRLLGTKQSPIEVDCGLTPKRINRLLFRSPRKEGEFKSLDDILASDGSEGLLPGNRNVLMDDSENNDKENRPPPVQASPRSDIEFEHLFEDSSGLPAPVQQVVARVKSHPADKADFPCTPNPASRKASTPKELLSLAAKTLFFAAATPTRSSTRKQRSPLLEQMTPFTAQLNQLLSEANSSPLKPSAGEFDFSVLGSLAPQTPGRFGAAFDFPDFGADDFFGTDAELASSPSALFQFYEDPVHEGLMQAEPGSDNGDTIHESDKTNSAGASL